MDFSSSTSKKNEVPIICLGQCSIQIGEAIREISKTIKFARGSKEVPEHQHDLHLYIDKEIGADKYTRCCLHLEPCNHLLPSSMGNYGGCETCNRNCNRILDRVHALFEASDNVRNVGIISDAYNQFACWSTGIVLDYINAEFPGISIISILMKPYMGGQGGIDSYFCLDSAMNALEFSSSVTFRGFDDMMFSSSGMDGSDSGVSNSRNDQHYSIAELNHIIACDLWTALAPNNGLSCPTGYLASSIMSRCTLYTLYPIHYIPYTPQVVKTSLPLSLCFPQSGLYHLWPHDVASPRSKVIDVRSSLYRALCKINHQAGRKQSTSSSRQPAEYNPMRSLASNLHSLHVSYAPKMQLPHSKWLLPLEVTTQWENSPCSTTYAIESANYADLYIDEQSRSLSLRPFNDVTSQQTLAALLKWATARPGPAILWYI